MSPLNNNSQSGKQYWRSLEEVSQTPEFQDYLHREFPEGASEIEDPVTRRSFMKFMAAGFALSGAVTLTGCRRPEEKILPYGKAPEEVIPGKAQFYASAYPTSRGSVGLLVKAHEGRPVKIEGNPQHPSNAGATDSFAQAELLNMYDPERLSYFTVAGQAVSTVDYDVLAPGPHRVAAEEQRKSDIEASNKAYDAAFANIVAKYAKNGGEGLYILKAPSTSPVEDALIAEIKKTFPKVSFHTYESINDDNAKKALSIFVKDSGDFQIVTSLDKASTVVSLDNDFMALESDSVRANKEFYAGRKVYQEKGAKTEKHEMNRLYSVESTYSLTGSNADHRLRLNHAQIEEFSFLLAQKVVELAGADSAVKSTLAAIKPAGVDLKKSFGTKEGVTIATVIDEIAKDLLADKKAGKASVILAGSKQGVRVHLISLVLNAVLGNFGKTVTVTEAAVKSEGLALESLSLLTNALNDKKVSTLAILGGNPVYDAPADLKFAEKLANAGETIHLTLFPNETTAAVKLAAPRAHFLESWDATRSIDGTVSFVQPIIAPLYDGLTDTEFLAKLFGQKDAKSHDLLKKHFGFSEDKWAEVLYTGFLKDSAFKAQSVSYDWTATARELKNFKAASASDFEVVITPDNSVLDGSFNNNGWMQELPDPITKLTWDNAALISYDTAQALGLDVKQAKPKKKVLSIEANGSKVELPYWIVPGIAKGTVHLQLGYGRDETGVVGKGSGFDVQGLRTTTNFYSAPAKVSVTSETYTLASTQDHWAVENRELIKESNIDDFNKTPNFAENHYDDRAASLFNDREELDPKNQVAGTNQYTSTNQWAMVIDLNQCNGCSACTVACQSENNISTVGKERVLEGREMHWIRMDRYFFTGSDINAPMMHGDITQHDEQVESVYQGMPCMQCENAPCEQVCPVAATVHSDEGLNDMVYNRCIGTRYCSNNCPYKVRRFNYFNHQEDFKTPDYEVKKMVHNPNVTVRSRGVMEKCTYCVQRINEAKIDAKVKNDGDLVPNSFTTACAQVCPTDAITFGNQNNAEDEVTKMQKEARNYVLLPEYNVRPRTSFLAKLRNQNKALINEEVKGGH